MQSASTSIAYCGLHSHPRGETWQGPPHRGQEMNSAHHVPRRSSEGQLHGTRDIQVTWERRACVSAQRMGRCYLMLPLRESCSPGGPERKTALASAWLRGIALYRPDTHEIAEMETLPLSKLRKALLSSRPSTSAPAAAVVPTVQHGPDKLCPPLPALGDSSTPIWRENFCPVL